MSTLTLSGWAQPADALLSVADNAATFDYSDYASIDLTIKELRKRNPTYVIAWSLGGVVALHAIAAGAIAPKHLTLIGVPFQFVQSAEYPHAMDRLTYERFRSNYARDAVRTKEKFLALIAKGDRDEGRILASLNHHHDVENAARWLPWLEALAGTSSPGGMDVPTLIIHGDRDAIVSHHQAKKLAEILPNAAVSLWEGVGHAPHLHDAARLRTAIDAHRQAEHSSLRAERSNPE